MRFDGQAVDEKVGGWVAAIARFMVRHFDEALKAKVGAAPHHYLSEQRTHRAKKLLLGTDIPIAQIADDVDFSGRRKRFAQLVGPMASYCMRWPRRCWSLRLNSDRLFGRLEDEASDHVRMGDHRDVTRFHLNGVSAHALGHEAFEIGVDGAVFG